MDPYYHIKDTAKVKNPNLKPTTIKKSMLCFTQKMSTTQTLSLMSFLILQLQEKWSVLFAVVRGSYAAS